MKAARLTFTIMFASLLLSGCLGVEKKCGYSMNYGCPYYGNSVCGPRIQYKCDAICDKCNANETHCKACWVCIKTD